MSAPISPFIPPMGTPRISPHPSPAAPVIPDPPSGMPSGWAATPQHPGSYPNYPSSPYTGPGFIPNITPQSPPTMAGPYVPAPAPIGYYTPAGPPHAAPYPPQGPISANYTGYPSLVPQSAPIMHHNTPYGPQSATLPPAGGSGWPGAPRQPYPSYGPPPPLQSAAPYAGFPGAYPHHGPPPGWINQTPGIQVLNFEPWGPQTPSGPPPGWPSQMGVVPPSHPHRGHSQIPDYRHDVRLDRMPPFVAGNHYGPVLEPFLIHVVRANIQLNPLLEPLLDTAPDRPHLKWNMLFVSNDCQRSTDPSHISWSTGRDEPATYPRVTSIKIVSETFPWVVDVKASDKNVGVTCGEVVDTLSDDFQRFASKADYRSLSPQKQALISETYHHNRSRAHGVPGGRLKEGMRRLDYLGKDTVFGGVYKDDRMVERILGAFLPCTFVLKCVRRYALTAEEIREHEERRRAREADRSARLSRGSDDDGVRPPSARSRRRSVTVSSPTTTSTSDD